MPQMGRFNPPLTASRATGLPRQWKRVLVFNTNTFSMGWSILSFPSINLASGWFWIENSGAHDCCRRIPGQKGHSAFRFHWPAVDIGSL